MTQSPSEKVTVRRARYGDPTCDDPECPCNQQPSESPPPTESNLVKHAEAELALIGMGADTPDEMNRLMHDGLIEMVQTFADQGHSGFSASYALSILNKLLDFQPISPLTGEDDEWGKHEPEYWQNKRCSHVFKDSLTGRAYDIQGRVFRGPDGDAWTGIESHVDITFPYTPVVEYVDVAE